MKFRTVLICLFALLILPLNVQAKTYSVTWDPRGIEQTLGLGGGVDLTATFVSKVTLNDVDLWIVPELQAFIGLNQTHFDVVEANTPYEITLHVSIPYGSQTGLYDGTIHLSVDSKTYPQTLKVELNVVDAAETIGPEGGVVEITDPNSNLLGAIVNVPQSALNEDTIISIKEVDIFIALPQGTVTGGSAIDLGPDGTLFNNNIQITIPYDDADNDGIVDYTGDSEDNISCVLWDDTNQIWIDINIISQDTQNNTITVETNHFTWFVLICDCVPRDDVVIFTIDGLNFAKTFLGDLWLWPKKEYLSKSIYKDMNLGLNKCDVIPYTWNGNAYDTPKIMPNLISTLKNEYDSAGGKKFILVTHSWGTILGMLTLKYNYNINPDLFITLSSPMGTRNVEGIPLDYELAINSFTLNRIDETIEKNGEPSRNIIDFNFMWKNYWAKGDLFSGPLAGPVYVGSADDERVDEGQNWRNLVSTKDWHFITTLNKKTMKYDKLSEENKEYADDLIGKVKSEIQSVIESSINDTTPPIILNTNFINNGDSETTSTTLSVNLTAKDESGIYAYQICAYIDKGPGPLTPELIDCIMSRKTLPIPEGKNFIMPPTEEYEVDASLQAVTVSIPENDDILCCLLSLWDTEGNRSDFSDKITYLVPTLPTIAQSPMSGPPGTAFVQWGIGFTPNSIATLHFQKPDGSEYPTQSQSLDSNGYFKINYTTPSDKELGPYTWWAVDDSTGIESNEVSYVITEPYITYICIISGCFPEDTFFVNANGFTPNSTATLHFKKPDGSEYPTQSQSTGSYGFMGFLYPVPLDIEPGIYTWWAIDDSTGIESNEVSYEITP